MFNSEKLANDLRVYQMKTGKTLADVQKDTGIKVSTLSRIRNKKENALFVEVAILAFEINHPITRYVDKEVTK